MPSSSPLKIYFAGELFSLKHLYGNTALAEAIYERSSGRFVSVLPQNLEQRETSPQAIRDQDLRSVIACDVGVFHYDGTELDSGTVVEYLMAKFADIPSVLLRTDFRFSGDQQIDPWNLMTSFFPRTEVVRLDGIDLYQKSLLQPRDEPETLLKMKAGSRAARKATENIAQKIIDALEKVIRLPAVLPRSSQAEIYAWLAQMPGFGAGTQTIQDEFARHLHRKLDQGLL